MVQKYKRAVGLEYKEGGASAPRLSLSALQNEADIAVKMAKRFGIPVVERPEIAKALSAFEVGSEIPEELFETVALIIAELDRRLGSY